MSTPTPRISIGLPVYNGARYLAAALDSLLGQTWPDFELIVADNASTDSTAAIAQAYAGRDARIRYVRNPVNLGAAGNYNRVLALARAELFKWAAYDDLCAPAFLARCVEVLDQQPEVVLCYPQTLLIDADGAPLGAYEDGLNLRSPDRVARYRQFHRRFRVGGLCNIMYGVIRTAALRRTPGVAPYPNSDVVLLGELALHGHFAEVTEPLFWRRDHPGMTVRAIPSVRQRATYLDPAQRRAFGHPYMRMLREHVAAVRRVPMPAGERLRCALVVGHFILWKAQIYLDDKLSGLPWPAALRRNAAGASPER